MTISPFFTASRVFVVMLICALIFFILFNASGNISAQYMSEALNVLLLPKPSAIALPIFPAPMIERVMMI